MSQKAAARRRNLERWLAVFVFAAVLLLRVVVLESYSSSPSSRPSGGDIGFYHQWAQRILNGELTDGRAFYALPFYAYWLAALYTLFGMNGFIPGLIQCAADAGTALLIYKLTELSIRAVDRTRNADPSESGNEPLLSPARIAGIVAALAWAFFVPAQTFAVIQMPTALAVFVFWFVVWQVVRRAERPPPWLVFFLGLLVGITAMAVATILFVLPLVVFAAFRKWKGRGEPFAGPFVASVILILGVIAGTAPCWLHNLRVGDPVFLSAHSGINFWIGNNPDATGYPKFNEVRAGQAEMLQDSIALAEQTAGRPLKRSEVSAFWSSRARTYIAANFGPWLQSLSRKIWNFWNAFQYDDLSVIAKLRKDGITFPGFGFGIIAALGLAALPFVLRSSPPSRWIFAAVLLQNAALLPVFVTERYRLAAVPGLVALAVLGLERFWRNAGTGHLKPSLVYVALLLCAATVVAVPPKNPQLWALEPYNSGRHSLEVGDLPQAERNLELARAYVPQNAEINLALGNLWFEKGDAAKAESFYHSTLVADPRHKSALVNLGVIALQQDRLADAIDRFRAALALAGDDAKSHYLLARALSASGANDEAFAEAAEAVRLNPKQPEFAAFRDSIPRTR
jgi:hypothetical protein